MLRQADFAGVAQLIEAESARAPFVDRIYSSQGYQRRKAIRGFYRVAIGDIRDAGAAEWGIDPYEVDWLRIFTPIEQALWHDIRAASAVLYPQFPAGQYFVDFGNPVARVAIECDGALWHQDKEKDQERQRAIEAMGWKVYRITGRDCKSDFNEERMERSPARKLIDEVVLLHGIGRK